MKSANPETNSTRRRLAIIGCGSSGLISLKMAIEYLPDWEIVCYEKSDSITGCWGNPYPGFVSTSTRYTTQFACFPVTEAIVSPDGSVSREEFFRGGEYGQYLESFADHFNLRQHVLLKHRVENVVRLSDGQWQLAVVGIDSRIESIEQFDSVVICTGLAAQAKPIASCDIPQLPISDLNRPGGLEQITNKTIVVIGGGESAVDYANRLARESLDNRVFLSLHSGVRVSPRYHPVRGVPSDFLRNRLMLSVHPAIRNRLGQTFVEWRIKYQPQFEKLFPARARGEQGGSDSQEDEETRQLRQHWALKLTLSAKDDLFNMFHNKSDDFLDAVGEERIQIVGPAADSNFNSFSPFGSQSNSAEHLRIEPDLIVPAIGYQSTLRILTDSTVSLSDFFLGCCHVQQSGLYLVGFARPIIGNIPSISEMQARYVCGLIAGKFQLPTDFERQHEADFSYRRDRYEQLNHESNYPVEMFPYCDRLARMMELPTVSGIPFGLRWWKCMLAPATTMHYFHDDERVRQASANAPVYMPALLVLFILFMKPVDRIYRLFARRATT